MASTSSLSSMTLTLAQTKQPISARPLSHAPPLRPSSAKKPSANYKFQVRASLKEKVVTGLTAAALTASMVVPEAAEAAAVSPSLKNFLLSIVAGGVVLAAIGGAVIGVANFDPVKRS